MSDLSALARDRPLLTRELHPVNAWYGHADVLKRYTGWPLRRSLKVAIEHGPWMDEEVWKVDARTRMPIYVCASPQRAAFFERRTGIEAAAIGPMIRYVMPENPALPEDPRTVAFPAHSTHHAEAKYAVEAFMAQLERVAKTSEVVVCLYWRDALLGLADVFERRGFRCVTAGHLYDAGFLDRLAKILASASRVVTNEIGTHVLYAALLNRPVFVASQPVEYVQERELANHRGDRDHPRVRRTRELFAVEAAAITSEQRSFVNELLGTSAFRTPTELREILEAAEGRYRALPWNRRARIMLARERHFASQQLALLRSSRAAGA